jgi:hypothetical protein
MPFLFICFSLIQNLTFPMCYFVQTFYDSLNFKKFQNTLVFTSKYFIAEILRPPVNCIIHKFQVLCEIAFIFKLTINF